MAITSSTMVVVGDEEWPCWCKLCNGNGFQWDLFPLTNPLHYVNTFFLKMVRLLKGIMPVFAKAATVPSGNGWI